MGYLVETLEDATIVIDAHRKHCPEVQGPKKKDICDATQNRQDAVKVLAGRCGLVIVVGSLNSSNSRRLKEVAVARGIDGYLVDGPQQIDPAWLAGKRKIGASAPEILVRRVVDCNGALTGAEVGHLAGVHEGISFPLPKGLVECARGQDPPCVPQSCAGVMIGKQSTNGSKSLSPVAR